MLFATALATVEVEMPIGDLLPNPTADERWIGTTQVRPDSSRLPGWMHVKRSRGFSYVVVPRSSGPEEVMVRGNRLTTSPTGDRVAWITGGRFPHLIVTSRDGTTEYRGCGTHYHEPKQIRWSGDARTIASVAWDPRVVDSERQVQWCDLATDMRIEQSFGHKVILGAGADTVYAVRQSDRTLEVSDSSGALVARIGNVPGPLAGRNLQPDRWRMGLPGFYIEPDSWKPLSTQVAAGQGGRVAVHHSGAMVACGERRTYVVDTTARRVLASVPEACSDPQLAGDRFIAGGVLWNLDGTEVRRLEPKHLQAKVKLRQAPDGKILRQLGNQVALYDAEGSVLHEWSVEDVNDVTFAKEGRVVVLASDEGVQVRSADTGEVLDSWATETWLVQARGNLLAVSEPANSRYRHKVRDLDTKRWLWSRTEGVEMVHLDPTGVMYAWRNRVLDGVLHVEIDRLNPRTGAVVERVGVLPHKVTWVGADADGRTVVKERFGPLRFGIDWSEFR